MDGGKFDTFPATYVGLPELYLVIDRITGKVLEVLREDQAFDGRPIPKDCTLQVLDCELFPLEAEVLSDYHDNYKDDDKYTNVRGSKTVPTPEGYEEFTYEYPIHPDELYDDKNTYWDFDSNKVVLDRNSNSKVLGDYTWDDVRKHRNELLFKSDSMAIMYEQVSLTKKEEIDTFRQLLRDLPVSLENMDANVALSCFPKTTLLEL